MDDTDKAAFQELRNEVMANRMVIRGLAGALAKVANPGDPREFVSSLEEALFAQLDLPGPLYDGDQGHARNQVRGTIREIIGRLDWGSD